MNSTKPNAQYNLAAADGLPARITAYQRRKMFDRFVSDTQVTVGETILDVGVTSDRTYRSSNYLEAWCSHKARITAVGVDDASFLCSQYPGVRFVRADGLNLPFQNRSFDVVHASAVIEHVGSFSRQCAFLRECCRVARRAVFITTPNRWFPVEIHTLLPFAHWLPKPVFRALMPVIGRGFFASEDNLNLMTASELRRAAALNDGFTCNVSHVLLGGWPSNLLLNMQRSAMTPHQSAPKQAPK